MTKNCNSKILTGLAAFAVITLSAASRCDAALVGQWTFENGSLADSTGNFGALVLQGDAAITGGALDVNGSGTNAPAGCDFGFRGVAIGAKTWSWITPELVGARRGSAMTIDSTTFDQFDGVCRDADRWMSGSNGFPHAGSSEPAALKPVWER
jgi:hypothetical protein